MRRNEGKYRFTMVNKDAHVFVSFGFLNSKFLGGSEACVVIRVGTLERFCAKATCKLFIFKIFSSWDVNQESKTMSSYVSNSLLM